MKNFTEVKGDVCPVTHSISQGTEPVKTYNLAWLESFNLSDLCTEQIYDRLLIAPDKEKAKRYADLANIARAKQMYSEFESSMRYYAELHSEDFDRMYWEYPIPFQDKLDLPVFPLNALSEPFKAFVDMVALGALGAFSAALQGKYVVEYGNAHREPLSLYVIVGADPAERKTSVLNLLRKPFADYQNALEAVMKPNDPLPRLFSSGDTTTEQLAVSMKQNNERLAIITEEGGIFDIWAGKYSKIPNFELIKQAYDGAEVTVDRKTSESFRLKNPLLSVLVYCQPDVIHKFVNNTSFKGQGLCGRFIYALPGKYAGSGNRRYKLSLTDGDVEAYEKAIEWYNGKILGFLKLSNKQPQVIKVSDEAEMIASVRFNLYEKLLGGSMAMYSDWVGKAFGHDNRISAILSIIDGKNEINLDTHNNAFAIGDYLLEHFKAVNEIVGTNITLQTANKILEFIRKYVKRTGSFEMTKREITRNINGAINSKQIDEVLDLIESANWIRRREATPLGGGTPSVRIFINPLLEATPKKRVISRLRIQISAEST